MTKVALVTGSGAGIGAATARRLAADGLTMAVHSRSSREAGMALAEELGGTYFQADLADDASAAGLVPLVLAEYGRLDVLVNNAGISWPVPHADLAALTAGDWRRLLDVNLIAPWLLCTAAVPALRESGGVHRQCHQSRRREAEGKFDRVCGEQGGAQPRDEAVGGRARS